MYYPAGLLILAIASCVQNREPPGITRTESPGPELHGQRCGPNRAGLLVRPLSFVVVGEEVDPPIDATATSSDAGIAQSGEMPDVQWTPDVSLRPLGGPAGRPPSRPPSARPKTQPTVKYVKLGIDNLSVRIGITPKVGRGCRKPIRPTCTATVTEPGRIRVDAELCSGCLEPTPPPSRTGLNIVYSDYAVCSPGRLEPGHYVVQFRDCQIEVEVPSISPPWKDVSTCDGGAPP